MGDWRAIWLVFTALLAVASVVYGWTIHHDAAGWTLLGVMLFWNAVRDADRPNDKEGEVSDGE